jgi:methylated-DNA-[protein]-cysteine S-methyltransferase
MRALAYYESPLGTLEVVCTEVGISEINFVREPRAEPPAELPPMLKECLTQLCEYFEGKRRNFSVKLDLRRGTPFHREVWKLVQAIPYGRTRCYSTIAETLGRPHASRAVGQANGRNPLPIIIPCHRVIGKDGGLTGYAYGLEVKEMLLALENPRKYAMQAVLWR